MLTVTGICLLAYWVIGAECVLVEMFQDKQSRAIARSMPPVHAAVIFFICCCTWPAELYAALRGQRGKGGRIAGWYLLALILAGAGLLAAYGSR